MSCRLFRGALALMLSLAVLAGACGGGGDSSQEGRGDQGDTTTSPSSEGGAETGVTEDPDHSLVLVNFHLDGTVGGPDYDVYQVPQDVEGIEPAVEGLAYGTASEPVHPGRRESAFDTGSFGLTLVPEGASPEDEAVLPPLDGDWKFEVVAVGGSGDTTNFTDYKADPDYDSNALPAPTDGKVTLLAVAGFVGDQTAGTALTGTVLFGEPGKCLPSSSPSHEGDAATAILDQAPFTVDPGTAKVGFFTTTESQYGPESCAGTPVAEADVSTLEAGSRAMVFLYGPSAPEAAALVVPVPG